MTYGKALLSMGMLAALLSTPTCNPPADADEGLEPPVPADCPAREDVTDDFNEWISTLGDGVTIALKPGGCYLSTGTIEFKNRRDITILGSGATIQRPRDAVDTNRPQLVFNMGSGFEVRDLTIQGSNFEDCVVPRQPSCYRSDREWDDNLRIYGSDRVLVDNVEFKNAWGDAVQAQPGPPGNGTTMARNITVQNSTVHTTGRHAFSCTGCRNMTVRDNAVTNIGYHLMDVEVEGKTWTGDVTLERNTYSKVHYSLLAAVAPNGKDIGPLIVRGNTQTDVPITCQPPVQVGRSGFPYHTVKISDNELHTLTNGVNVAVADAEVTGNTIEFVPGGGCANAIGIAFADVPHGSIIRNSLIGFPTLTRVTPPNPEIKNCGNRTTETGPFDQPKPC